MHSTEAVIPIDAKPTGKECRKSHSVWCRPMPAVAAARLLSTDSPNDFPVMVNVYHTPYREVMGVNLAVFHSVVLFVFVRVGVFVPKLRPIYARCPLPNSGLSTEPPTIPAWYVSLSRLPWASFCSAGPIPAFLAELTALTTLYLGGSGLAGKPSREPLSCR